MLNRGLIFSAPFSGSGKTLITLGLIRALKNQNYKIAPAKIGPDYIDVSYLNLAANKKPINIDSFAFKKTQLNALAYNHAKNSNYLLIEGAMGLFDGALIKSALKNSSKIPLGSTADIAIKLNLPIILIIDCSHMAQSIGAMIYGYMNYSKDINITGVILNKVGSKKHEIMLRQTLKMQKIKILGAIYRHAELEISSRHLGLTLPQEITKVENLINNAANIITNSIDLDNLLELSLPIKKQRPINILAPLGQHIAIAKDDCFAFIYQHFLTDWQNQGAQLRFFSPLNNEAPDIGADAVFLPGGYPELYAKQLSNAIIFKDGMMKARDRGALIYGECGGFMVLGKTLIDANGISHKMSGLLPITSTINKPKRVLGYRYLTHNSPLPFAKNLIAHEFHYSTCANSTLPALFKATDAKGEVLADMGIINNNVMGSYAHIISANEGA